MMVKDGVIVTGAITRMDGLAQSEEVSELFTLSKKSRDPFIEEIHDKIKALPTKEREEWLRILYQARTDRFLAENSKIWTTGQIFVPVALGPFAVWAAIDNPTFYKFCLLCGISVSIAVFWHCISHVHRNYQNTHMAWLHAIEQFRHIDVLPPQKPFSMLLCRRCLTVLILAAWIGIGFCEWKDLKRENAVTSSKTK